MNWPVSHCDRFLYLHPHAVSWDQYNLARVQTKHKKGGGWIRQERLWYISSDVCSTYMYIIYRERGVGIALFMLFFHVLRTSIKSRNCHTLHFYFLRESQKKHFPISFLVSLKPYIALYYFLVMGDTEIRSEYKIQIQNPNWNFQSAKITGLRQSQLGKILK